MFKNVNHIFKEKNHCESLLATLLKMHLEKVLRLTFRGLLASTCVTLENLCSSHGQL